MGLSAQESGENAQSDTHGLVKRHTHSHGPRRRRRPVPAWFVFVHMLRCIYVCVSMYVRARVCTFVCIIVGVGVGTVDYVVLDDDCEPWMEYNVDFMSDKLRCAPDLMAVSVDMFPNGDYAGDCDQTLHDTTTNCCLFCVICWWSRHHNYTNVAQRP